MPASPLDFLAGSLIQASLGTLVVCFLVASQLTHFAVTLHRHQHRAMAHRAVDVPAPVAYVFRFWTWLTTPMRLLPLLPLMLVALSLPLPGHAQVRETGDYLRRMDRNGDSRVSLAEYQAWMGYGFERMDRNRDGVLGADELPGGRGKPVSLAAHRESLAAAFRRQDTNHDGMLDARELAAPPPR